MPDEYIEDPYAESLDADEELFRLNLIAHNRAEIDYSQLCLDAVDLWLNKVKSSDNYSAKQNITITSILKGRRMLRAAQLQLFRGFLPEAEILYRSVLEVSLVLAYVLNDSTEGRAKKYLKFDKKQRWDFALLAREFVGEQMLEVYSNLSLYLHPHNLGNARLVHNNVLQRGAIHDYEHGGRLLVMLGNCAVGLCEQSNVLFGEDLAWDKKHQEIYETEIFKRNIKKAQEMIDQENEMVTKALTQLEKTREKNGKK